jgi:hypothetical protein
VGIAFTVVLPLAWIQFHLPIDDWKKNKESIGNKNLNISEPVGK